MSFVYIAGPTASGKSALTAELQKLGYEAFDEDDPEIGSAHKLKSEQPVRIPDVSNRDKDWFSKHQWRVYDEVLDKLVSKSKHSTVILVGNSLSTDQVEEIVDILIYLDVSTDEVKTRISNRLDNDYGKSEDELLSILKRNEEIRSHYIDSADVVVDADAPLTNVIDRLIDAIKS